MQTFLFHPSDLQKRRSRCQPVVAQLSAFDREEVHRCNMCGTKATTILANQDRYGLPIRTAICAYCGLIYLVDRFTPASYSDFYLHGHYRSLVSAFKGHRAPRQPDPAWLRETQTSYARQIGDAFRGYFETLPKNARLLDVGGGVGLVAHEFVKRFGFSGTVIDPSREVDAAGKLGLRAIVGSVETWRTDETFDLVLLCRTIEHVFDLRSSLERIRNLLNPGGLFFCDIAEFMEVCRRDGPAQATTKIDHCFWLTQETAVSMFRSCGLKVISSHIGWAADQVGYLLTAAEPVPLTPLDAVEADRQLRALRQMDADWRRAGMIPTGPVDWLRHRAYNVKRRLAR